MALGSSAMEKEDSSAPEASASSSSSPVNVVQTAECGELTAEQLEALTAGGQTQQVIAEDGSAVYYTYVTPDDPEEEDPHHQPTKIEVEDLEEQQQQEDVVEASGLEAQEVFVLDEDTGEYQKCLYVPQPQEEDGEQQHQQQHLVQEDQHEEQQIQVSEEPVVGVGGEQQQQQQIQLAIQDLDGSQQPLDPSSVDLQALLENGTINPETFAALTGHSVNIIQESDLPEAQLEQDENGVVRIVQAAPIQQHQQQEVVDGDHGVLSQHGEEIKMSDLLALNATDANQQQVQIHQEEGEEHQLPHYETSSTEEGNHHLSNLTSTATNAAGEVFQIQFVEGHNQDEASEQHHYVQQQQQQELSEQTHYQIITAREDDQENDIGIENRAVESQFQQIVECGKCHLRFRQEDFEPHFNEAHRDEQFLSFSVSNSSSSANAGLVGFDASSSSSSFSSGNNKTCSICLKVLTKKDYLEHFKESHSDVRLGCPKCPQTYHSPELLNVHYKHFHFKKSSQAVSSSERADEFALQGEDGRTTLKNVRLLRKCKVCQALVSNLAEHRHKRILPAPSPAAASASSVIAAVAVASSSSVRTKPKKRTIKHCDVCQKDFGTQREFANHRRRKDFCRPPISANPPQRRRIGIIRKSL